MYISNIFVSLYACNIPTVIFCYQSVLLKQTCVGSRVVMLDLSVVIQPIVRSIVRGAYVLEIGRYIGALSVFILFTFD